MVLTLVRAYSDARTIESPDFQRFCDGCTYQFGPDACSQRARIQAVEHNQCDWSMIAGVGAMPRTLNTLSIYDPTKDRYIEVQRRDIAAVREAVSRNLRARP